MNAAEFEALFDDLVRQPALEAGWEPWSKTRLRIAQGPVRAALVRSELRHTWPFKLTFLASHERVRDFDDAAGGFPPNPNEWVVKSNPLALKKAIKRYRYQPFNLGTIPGHTFSDRRAPKDLRSIGKEIVAAVPILERAFSAEALLAQLRQHGEGAWCEQRWIEDLTQNSA